MECHKTEDGQVIAIFSPEEMKMIRIAIGEGYYLKYKKEGIPSVKVDQLYHELECFEGIKENGHN